ncbi:MAG: serine--tRNA ligase [Ignavibacteriaceae bacterium]|nr:serine--tRNA ligase [Ignavibacteriaceae bacterium]
MLDIKLIRENPGLVKTGLTNKNDNHRIDELLELDKKRRELITLGDELKNQKNKVSEEIPKLKKAGTDTQPLFEEMRQLGEKIKKNDDELRVIEEEFEKILLFTPNLPHESVPVGKSAEDNLEVRRWIPEGLNIETKKEVLDHIQLGKNNKILDFDRGTKITGSGFPLYTGRGATLERALISFMLDFHIRNHGYTEVMTPFIVNKDSMRGTGQLPKMADDMYFIERDGLYLIPTAEVPITNIYRNETLEEETLPVKFVGYSPCFRREAGSYGRDSKGFLRVHQFNKVEMVKFVKPENSYDELESLVANAEAILKALNVPYRILLLCTGDLSFSAAKCYDIETWSPAEHKWLEASSCSNFESFQARRANIKYKAGGKKGEFVHTLNGSGLATSRLMVSLLENNQQPDGSIVIPEALRPYTGFDVIEPNRS